MRAGSDRRLVAETLSTAGYEVVTGDDADLPETFDCCLLDARTLDEVAPALRERRTAADPTFLPCLLVVTDRRHAGDDPLALLPDDLAPLVDDALVAPVRRNALHRRVESLLRVRRLSLDIEESRERYRRLVDLLPEATFLLRRDRIVYCNRAAATTFSEQVADGGRQTTAPSPPQPSGADPPPDLTGRDFLSLAVPADRHAVARALHRARTDGESDFVEASLRAATGVTLTAELAAVRVGSGPRTTVQVVVRDVTERDRRESRLRLYQRAMNEATVGITIADATEPDNPLVYANDRFLDLVGLPRRSVLGQNPRLAQVDETDPETVAMLRTAIDAAEPISVEILNGRADGATWWNALDVMPVEDETGTVTHFLGFQRDVTDQVERERELAATRDELRATFERIADGFFSLDEAFRFTYLNERAEEYAPVDDPLGESIWDVFPEARGTVFEENYREAMATGEPTTFVGPYARDDEVRRLEVAVYPDDEGLSVFFRDVTERLRREVVFESLHAVTERMQDADSTGAVFDIAVEAARDVLDLPLTVCWRLEDGQLVPVAATDDAWGAGPASYAPGDPQWAAFEAGEATTFDEGSALPDDLDVALLFPLGEYGLLGAAAHGADDYPDYLLDAGRVLADHVTTALGRASREESLRDRERTLRRYETIIQAAGDPIYTLDTEGRFTSVNDAMVALTGYDRGRLLGSDISLVLDETDIARCERHIRDLLHTDEDTRTAEVDVETAGGQARRCEINIALLPMEDDRVVGTVGVLRDVTDREHRRQRLAVLDRVLRHNIRNKLNLVLGRAAELGGRVADDPTATDDVEVIVAAADSLLEMAEKVRDFHKSGRTEVRERDVADAVLSVATECRERYPDAVVRVEGAASAPALADGGVELAVRELVENAIEHGGDDPTVTVGVREVTENGREWVEVSVTDDGPGIPEGELAAFTGAPETALSHATGIGLWLVAWLASRVGGTVAHDAEESGTTVRLRLRRVPT
jgi:PAS domain S-box-containing protein